MHVLFDAMWLDGGPPSGKNVVQGLLSGWVEAFPDDTLELLVPSRFDEARALEWLPRGASVALRRTRIKPHGLAVMLARRKSRVGSKEPDIVVTQNYTPLRRMRRKTVLIHDVIFKRRPEWFSLTQRLYFAAMLPSAAKAAHVVSTSRSECAAISKQLGGRPVYPIGLSVSEELLNAECEPTEDDGRVARYVLAVGRRNARKNIDFATKALYCAQQISSARPFLVVGPVDGVQETTMHDGPLVEAKKNGAVRYLGYVSPGRLKHLYENADFILCPSLDEGFDLPVAEALLFKKKIALSDIPAHRDFGNAVGYFFDPADAAGLVAACTDVMQHTVENEWTTRWQDVAGRLRHAALIGDSQ